MTTRRTYTRRDAAQLAPETTDSLRERARRLPLSGPGRVTTIPLSLLPAYLELHHLEVLDKAEIRLLAQRGFRKPDGIAMVKRIKIERNHESHSG